MTVYLVDFENVRSGGLQGVENLGEDDKVVIFYSKNADAITFDVHNLLAKSKAEIETFRILRGGKNSLDFQLSTYLGYLVMENCYRKIYIVSQDKGFLCAMSFWEENYELCNAQIGMCKSIATAETEVDDDIDFEDGLSGKFIEKINYKREKRVDTESIVELESSKNQVRGARTYATRSYKNKNQNEEGKEKKSAPKKRKMLTREKTQEENVLPEESQVKEAQKETVQKGKSPKPNLNIQNPTSKNKIFTAEIKWNVTEDIENLVKGKCEVESIPFIVESFGLSTGKQDFYRMLVSKFGQEQGKEVYAVIKGQYANLKRK